jgi:hypothetical protein
VRRVSDNVQQIADEIRAALRKGYGGSFRIEHPDIAHPLDLDVIVDGATAWLVKLRCGERVLFDTGHQLCVKPDELISGLYVFLRAAIRAMTTPAPRPS